MKRVCIFICGLIRHLADFFYPPFRKYLSLQFFRYGFTGCINLLFDWSLYFFIYNYILHQQMLELGFITIGSHIATFCIKMPIVLVFGFVMQKYITFSSSELRGRVQLARYLVVFLVNILINYLGLKLFVEVFHWYATLSNMAVSLVTVVISYFSQKHFTFRTDAQKKN